MLLICNLNRSSVVFFLPHVEAIMLMVVVVVVDVLQTLMSPSLSLVRHNHAQYPQSAAALSGRTWTYIYTKLVKLSVNGGTRNES